MSLYQFMDASTYDRGMATQIGLEARWSQRPLSYAKIGFQKPIVAQQNSG